jgi:hypothetical protein
MKTFLILILNVFCTLLLLGQTNVIEGFVIDRRSNEKIYPSKIELFDSTNRILRASKTFSSGRYILDSLGSGEYNIRVQSRTLGDSVISKITILENDTLKLNLYLPKPCYYENKTGICSNCKNDSCVISISPNLVVHYNFKSKRFAKKYYKEKYKKGYETAWEDNKDYLTQYETLIWIQDEIERDKFHNPCYHWFCKNCRIVF